MTGPKNEEPPRVAGAAVPGVGIEAAKLDATEDSQRPNNLQRLRWRRTKTGHILLRNNCYSASMSFLIRHQGAEYVLVHAIVSCLGDNGHAWVETPDRQTVL